MIGMRSHLWPLHGLFRNVLETTEQEMGCVDHRGGGYAKGVYQRYCSDTSLPSEGRPYACNDIICALRQGYAAVLELNSCRQNCGQAECRW